MQSSLPVIVSKVEERKKKWKRGEWERKTKKRETNQKRRVSDYWLVYRGHSNPANFQMPTCCSSRALLLRAQRWSAVYSYCTNMKVSKKAIPNKNELIPRDILAKKNETVHFLRIRTFFGTNPYWFSTPTMPKIVPTPTFLWWSQIKQIKTHHQPNHRFFLSFSTHLPFILYRHPCLYTITCLL